MVPGEAPPISQPRRLPFWSFSRSEKMTTVPFSRPARIFAGYCYKALGEGWCVGAAVWQAGQACRQELGEDHPAWLSYGLQGYGSLALQYL